MPDDESLATAHDVAEMRSTMDDPLLPWRRPDATPFRLAELGADVLDGDELRLVWWPEGQAYVLAPDGAHRTVLSIASARRLAAVIIRHLDETDTLDELDDEGEG